MQPTIKNLININPTQHKNSFTKEYAGFVNFKEIEPYLRFTSRNHNTEDKNNHNTLYQRMLDESRVRNIQKFLDNHYSDEDTSKILPFPTPVTLSIESEFIETDPEGYFKKNSDTASVIYKDQLYINPDMKKSILIVDGQHRLAGIKEFTKNNLLASSQEIYIYLTLLINYDLSMQAKVFANINFQVKPVNKSLYYDIFGSLPDEYNELTFAHILVKRINKDEDIGGLIKMLGTGSGTVSLAFMVETIVDELTEINKRSGEKQALYDICQLYMKDQEKFKKKYGKLGKLFIEYFKIIKDELPDTFPKKESNGEYKSSSYDAILMKTTGVFSLLKLLNRIDIKGILEANQTDDEMKKSFVEKLHPILTILKENEKDFFSKDSQFASGGGKSLQQKLYKAIEGKINEKKA